MEVISVNLSSRTTVCANLGSHFSPFRFPQLQDEFDDVYFKEDF